MGSLRLFVKEIRPTFHLAVAAVLDLDPCRRLQFVTARRQFRHNTLKILAAGSLDQIHAAALDCKRFSLFDTLTVPAETGTFRLSRDDRSFIP